MHCKDGFAIPRVAHGYTDRDACRQPTATPPLSRRVLVSRMRGMSWLRRNSERLLRIGAGAELLVSVCAVAFAQASSPPPHSVITVSGTVRDPSGAPIADASVFLDEKATNSTVETKTKSDGTFSFLASRAGTYVVRARMQGFRDALSETMELSLGEKKELELVMNVAIGGGVVVEKPPLTEPGAAKSGDMEFSDKPSFTVAGVTDWTNVGGHGPATELRTSDSLARSPPPPHSV